MIEVGDVETFSFKKKGNSMQKSKQIKANQPQAKPKKAKKEQKKFIIKAVEKPQSGDNYNLPFTD